MNEGIRVKRRSLRYTNLYRALQKTSSDICSDRAIEFENEGVELRENRYDTVHW